MKRILVDVMGGDHAPAETVKGAYLAADELDCELVLVGDGDEIHRIANENGWDPNRFEIVHTKTVIAMEDEPIAVRRAKADSSMSLALKMLADGNGDAMVSTGNTGALFAGATLIVRKIGGVHCPAIAALLPMQPPVLLLDSGANLNVSAEDLEQFAIMGSIYMKKTMGLENPRVGLLNNGAEQTKGTALQIEAYRLLSASLACTIDISHKVNVLTRGNSACECCESAYEGPLALHVINVHRYVEILITTRVSEGCIPSYSALGI